GRRTFTVAATDALGNRASRSVDYVVGYGVCLLYDPNQPVKLTTSTIPIKLQLCDRATGRNLSAPSIGLTATRLVKVVNGTETQVKLDPNSGTGTTVFRYDPQIGVTGGYIYNLQTKTLAPASKYRLYFTIDAEPALPDGSRAERFAALATR
ncbi:MAG TPA: hypothetical protein VEC09_02360, partial [Actinomycetota bacterium]|nr:hypothetical protein [Actinomycetota bacterium]